MKSQDNILQQLKEHENRVKSYQEKAKQAGEQKEVSYKMLAYQVKNPFRGI